MFFASRKFRVRYSCAYLTTLIVLAAVLPSRLSAQDIRQVKRFTTVNGTIDFLPGAWVNVWESGHSKYYRYEREQFVQSPNLPLLLRGWESFDWGSVDNLDQLAIQDYDPGIHRYLPARGRVKQVEQILVGGSRNGARSSYLYLVCFTLKTADKYAVSADDTDIFITAVKETDSGGTPAGKGMAYKKTTYAKLWTRKVKTDAAYGQFTVQDIPKVGRFALLYWESSGGSGTDQGLDVFRVME